MLRFSIDPASEALATIDVQQAYLIGSHDLSVDGEIARKGNLIECTLRREKAAGLNLQCETREMGRLALSTCLLEQRDAPYSLLLELARHRIKHFIAKCEDWQIWDHPGAAEAVAQWNDAREHFTAAMTNSVAAQADALSAKALIAGLKASEKLAVAHAQVLMHRRYGLRAASKVVLGVEVDEPFDATIAKDAVNSFDMLSVPVVWSKIETKPGKFDFSSVEPWLDAAVAQKRQVLVGPVIDLRPGAVPAWIESKRGDFTALRDGIWKFSEAVGKALAERVGMWNIATGINDNEWWPLRLEEMVEITRRCSVALRQARKNVPTIIEIARPFGHDVGSRRWAVTPRTIIEAMGNDGIHLDCILLQLLMGEPGGDHLTRDLLEVSALLDSYIPLRKPVFVELGAPSAPIARGAGYWRAAWSPKAQSVWAMRMFAIAMSKPHVEMVIWRGLSDSSDASQSRGLIAKDRAHKPAFDVLLGVRKALRAPLGPWSPATSHSTSTSKSASTHSSNANGA